MARIATHEFERSIEELGPDEFLIRRRLQCGMLGVDRVGNASVVFPCTDRPLSSGRTSGQIRTTVEARVEIREKELIQEVSAVCLRCLDPALLPTFCTLVDVIDTELSATRPLTTAAVLNVVKEWERLFRSRRHLGRDEEVGLWGELWLLDQSERIEAAVAAWRGPDPARLDFVGPQFAIEVKTSLSGHAHRTTVDQIRLGDAFGNAFLLSLWVAESPDGRALPALVEAIRGRSQASNEFERRLALTGYSDSDADCYDRQLVVVAQPLVIEWNRLPRITSYDARATNISYTFDVQDEDSLASDAVPRF
jgi:hypothetical protein